MTDQDYNVIKQGDKEMKLFKSIADRRLVEFGETFSEYKVRQKIMTKLLRKNKHQKNNNILKHIQ